MGEPAIITILARRRLFSNMSLFVRWKMALLIISCSLFCLAAANTSFVVTTEAELLAAISANASISLAADVYLTSPVEIIGIVNLFIDGHGFKVRMLGQI